MMYRNDLVSKDDSAVVATIKTKWTIQFIEFISTKNNLTQRKESKLGLPALIRAVKITCYVFKDCNINTNLIT